MNGQVHIVFILLQMVCCLLDTVSSMHGEPCSMQPLGMQNSAIDDTMISASSSEISETEARLHFPSEGWIPFPQLNDPEPWIQVAFLQPAWLSMISTQAPPTLNPPPEGVMVEYALLLHNNNPKWIQDTMVLSANYTNGSNEIIDFHFKQSLRATEVRLHVLRGFDFGLRLELYGCWESAPMECARDVDCDGPRICASNACFYKVTTSNLLFPRFLNRTDCWSPLGLESGDIANSQISASSSRFTGPSKNARLGEYGAWSPDDNDPTPWIRVDFLQTTIVNGMATQGQFIQFVMDRDFIKNATVEYGLGSTNSQIMENGQPKVFRLNFEEKEIVTNIFPYPVITDFIKIVILSPQADGVALRLELYGCPLPSALACLNNSDCYEGNNYECKMQKCAVNNTEDSTTQVPTTQMPTTQVPSTRVPTTEAETTQAPTTENPTTRVPTTQMPTTQVPTTENPTTQVPTTQVPTTENPTTQVPTTQVPTTENPTTRVPTTQVPTTENPTTQVPTTENPTTQVPTTQVPTTENPTTRVPTTQVPTTENPTTQVPTTENPTTQVPTTQVPTTQMPTTQVPTTQVPTTQVPTTENPTTQMPTTENPTTQVPTTQAPTTQVPTTQAPTTQAPTTQMPTTQMPTTENPTTQMPTTQMPTTENPTTQVPTTQAPTIQVPVKPTISMTFSEVPMFFSTAPPVCLSVDALAGTQSPYSVSGDQGFLEALMREAESEGLTPEEASFLCRAFSEKETDISEGVIDVGMTALERVTTNKSKPMAPHDLVASVNFLQSVAGFDWTLSRNNSKNMLKKMVNVGSNLLDLSNSKSWRDAEMKQSLSGPFQIINSLEEMVLKVGSNLDKASSIEVVSENIAITLYDVSPDELLISGWQWASSDSMFAAEITAQEFQQKNFSTYERALLIGGVFKNIGVLSHDDEPDPAMAVNDSIKKQHLSDIVTVIASSDDKVSLSVSFSTPKPLGDTVFQHDEEPKFSCVFWEYSSDGVTGSGRWSEFGCYIEETVNNDLSCFCNHTTNFAVLMQVVERPVTQVPSVHDTILLVLTYICITVSIISLVIALIIFVYLGSSLTSERLTIHKNLMVALLLAMVLFLVGVASGLGLIPCKIVAISLHYLFLAVFSWMLVEGVHLYRQVIAVFEHGGSKMPLYYATGWGLPAIVVGISVGIKYRLYGTGIHCWLTAQDGLIWAFVGPVILITIVNMLVLIMVMVVVNRAAALKCQTNTERIQAACKSALMLVPLLGSSWIIGLLTHFTIVLEYVFIILNGLQGFFLFVFHCMLNSEVRTALRHELKKRADRNMDSSGYTGKSNVWTLTHPKKSHIRLVKVAPSTQHSDSA